MNKIFRIIGILLFLTFAINSQAVKTPISNGQLTTDLDANGHSITNAAGYSGTAGVASQILYYNSAGGLTGGYSNNTFFGNFAISGVSTTVKTVTSAYTITTNDQVILNDTTSAGFIDTLPSATGITNQFHLVNLGPNSLIVTNFNGTDTINGLASYTNATYQLDAWIQADGAGHWVILSPGPTPSVQNVDIVNTGALNVATPIATSSGGTGLGSVDAGDLLSGNGTGTMDKVTLGSGLVLGGTAGAGTRVLTATGSVAYGISFTNIQTTDATVTPVFTNTFATNNTFNPSVRIVGAGQTNDYYVDGQDILGQVTSTGATILGTNAISLIASNGLKSYFTTSGNSFILNVVGKANEIVNWQGQGFYMQETNGRVLSCLVAFGTGGTSLNQNVSGTTGANGYPSQLIQVSSTITVCSIDVQLGNAGGSTYTIEFWTGPNRTGTQIGTGVSMVCAGTDFDDQFTFNWSSPTYLTLTSDCYLTVVPPTSSTTYNVGASDTNPYNPGSTYTAYQGASNTGKTAWDFIFHVYTIN